jgi:hypothetical protein
VAVAFDKGDGKIIVLAAGAVIAAGLVVALVLLVATSTGKHKPGPFPAGLATAVENDLKDGGPYFYPDPFEGNRNILLALEDGKIVALSNIVPNSKSCVVKWKGSVDSFVDCHGDKLDSTELARFAMSIPKRGNFKGILLIDPRELLPAPNPA